MNAEAREAGWERVHEALPARWQVGPPGYSPADHLWHVTAIGPHPGRGKMPRTVTGAGEDETAALRDMDDRLRGALQPDGSRMDGLRRRLRLAYVQGANEWADAKLGRRPTRCCHRAGCSGAFLTAVSAP